MTLFIKEPQYIALKGRNTNATTVHGHTVKSITKLEIIQNEVSKTNFTITMYKNTHTVCKLEIISMIQVSGLSSKTVFVTLMY